VETAREINSMSNTTISTKALVTLCDGEDDYFAELFEIEDDGENSAKALAREVAGEDLKRHLHCAWVQVGSVQHHFERDELQEVEACRTCASPETFKPSHNGSPRCQSGSIASGGKNAHCSCGVCF
jgi:hypothetical protein